MCPMNQMLEGKLQTVLSALLNVFAADQQPVWHSLTHQILDYCQR